MDREGERRIESRGNYKKEVRKIAEHACREREGSFLKTISTKGISTNTS